MARQRQLQIFDGRSSQFVEERGDQAAIGPPERVSLRNSRGSVNQLPQQWRHRERAARLGQSLRRIGLNEQAKAFRFTGTSCRVWKATRNPDCALRRDDPNAAIYFAFDDAAHRIKELRLAMVMLRLLPFPAHGRGGQGDDGTRDDIDIDVNWRVEGSRPRLNGGTWHIDKALVAGSRPNLTLFYHAVNMMTPRIHRHG